MNKKHLPVFSFVLILVAVFAFTSNHSNRITQKNAVDTIAPVIIRAKDHLGKSIVSKSGVISFTTGLENDFYYVDSLNKSAYFYVEVKLSKFLNDHSGRIPLNISIVIDRSSSMQGIKMGYAKRAAKNIIDQLKAEDIVSIVVYDNNVDTIQPPIRVIEKEKIKSKIDLIIPQASTNLWGGTEQGYQFVKRNFKTGYVNRVLLISDGLANVGLTDSTLIKIKVQKYKDDEGISISTFGVGLDYNETLMTDMAETGAGNYYFVDAPDKMTAIFNNELNGLLSVAAQNAELRIKLPKRITIQKGYPLKWQQNGDEIIVKLRDLSSEEIKATLFTFRIGASTNEVFKVTSTLTYTDATDGQQKSLTNENFLSPVKDVDAYLTHFNKQVIEQTILYTANENLETAMNLMEKGDYKEAGKYLSSNSGYLKANFIYVNKDAALMKLDSVNSNYSVQYLQAEAVSKDSVKRIQKASKAVNYKIRNKKQ
ncbi:MAG TPA: VWA domain-containing protein [Flavisolibacter sp.]|nr:VWA domain-containing protein [Flavisolibacter sp.]